MDRRSKALSYNGFEKICYIYLIHFNNFECIDSLIRKRRGIVLSSI